MHATPLIKRKYSPKVHRVIAGQPENDEVRKSNFAWQVGARRHGFLIPGALSMILLSSPEKIYVKIYVKTFEDSMATL